MAVADFVKIFINNIVPHRSDIKLFFTKFVYFTFNSHGGNSQTSWDLANLAVEFQVIVNAHSHGSLSYGQTRVVFQISIFDPRGRPQSRPVVITILTSCPSVPKLQNQAKITACRPGPSPCWPSGSSMTSVLSNLHLNTFLLKYLYLYWIYIQYFVFKYFLKSILPKSGYGPKAIITCNKNILVML